MVASKRGPEKMYYTTSEPGETRSKRLYPFPYRDIDDFRRDLIRMNYHFGTKLDVYQSYDIVFDQYDNIVSFRSRPLGTLTVGKDAKGRRFASWKSKATGKTSKVYVNTGKLMERRD